MPEDFFPHSFAQKKEDKKIIIPKNIHNPPQR